MIRSSLLGEDAAAGWRRATERGRGRRPLVELLET